MKKTSVPRSTTTQLDSIRAFAAHIGRSHTTVSRWVKREDWPFGPGPWSLHEAADALEWAECNLQENRALEPEPDPAAAAVLLDAFPELLDRTFRRELDHYVTDVNSPMPDADAARAREVARLRTLAEEIESRA